MAQDYSLVGYDDRVNVDSEMVELLFNVEFNSLIWVKNIFHIIGVAINNQPIFKKTAIIYFMNKIGNINDFTKQFG